jgi:outer membrane receptor for monomeric catechols
LQGFGKKHQIGLKYDWYDPNTQGKNTELKNTTKLTVADIRYVFWNFQIGILDT